MASVESNSPTPAWRQHFSFVLGMFWGALLLLLLAVWTGVKFYETAYLVAWGIGALAAVCLVAALWQLRVLLQIRQTAAKQDAVVAEQRSLVGFLALGLTVLLLGLLGLLVWLNFEERLLTFPIVSTGVALALIGLVAGLVQFSEAGKRFQPEQVLNWLQARNRVFALVRLVLGLVMFVGGIVMFVRNSVWEVLPQGGGLLLLGLAFIGVALWQLLALQEEALSKINIRIMVLTLGGAIGVVISLMTAVGAIQSWDTIFAGGMNSWQGRDAWKLWLVIWLELFGLALMFGSLFIAYGDIRKNITLRRLIYGYNAVFVGLLLLAVLVVLNILVYATFPYTYNWTQNQGFYSLSDRSKQILSDLGDRTYIYVTMSQGSSDYSDVRTLLENAQAYTDKLRVEYVSPELKPARYEDLEEDYSSLAGRGLLIVYGQPKGEREPANEFIPQDKLTNRKELQMRQFHQRGKEALPPHEFRGEDLLMTKLSYLEKKGKEPIVYFTQSNGELNLEESNPQRVDGAGILKEFLKRNNFKPRQLFWGTRPEGKMLGDTEAAWSQKDLKDRHRVPADAEYVIIAWPKQPYTKDVLDALQEYMDGGGKMIVMSIMLDDRNRPIQPSLQEFLKKYDVEMGKDIVIMAGRARTPEGFIVPYIPVSHMPLDFAANSDNPLAKKFKVYQFYGDAPRSVKPGKGSGQYQATTLMEIRPRQGLALWAEDKLSVFPRLDSYVRGLFIDGTIQKKMPGEPISVAVTVSDRSDKPRMIVYGEGRLASNAPTAVPGRSPPPAKDLMVSSLEYLGGRPQNIGIAPKKSNRYVMRSDVNERRLMFLPLGLMVLGFVGMGIGVWVVRRR